MSNGGQRLEGPLGAKGVVTHIFSKSRHTAPARPLPVSHAEKVPCNTQSAT